MTKKKLEEVFDIPEPKKEQHSDHEKCGCGKPPNKMDNELKSEIDKYLDGIKTQIKETPEPKKPRKHTFTAEGKAKMLENIKKARDVRRQKIESAKPVKTEQKVETKEEQLKSTILTLESKTSSLTEPKTEPKTEHKAEHKAEPKSEPKVEQKAEPKVETVVKPQPVPQPIIQQPKYIIKSFKKAPWA